MADEKIEVHERLTKLEGSMKTAYNRLEDVEIEVKDIKSDNKILHEMNKNIAVLATNYEYQGKKIDSIETDLKDLKNRPIPDITELEGDVKELKEKPGKRWDTLVTVIITVIASGIVGYFIGKVLGGGS
jgi:predicted RNase H-like nuclease (RuvC/YqgF family)